MKVLELDQMEQAKALLGSKPATAIHKNATHIMGFCFDGTTSFRPGARFGPDAIRDASFGTETYSPYLDKDLEDYTILDCGNLPIYPSKWKLTNDYFHGVTSELRLKSDQIKFLTLGGEHSVSYGPMRLCLDNYNDLVILHLDAHTDLRDGYLEEKFSHASIIKRVWDHMSKSQELIQYGIRSGTKAEFEFMREQKTLASSLEDLVQRLESIDNSRPIYLTLDLDFFDPAFMPGTGTPEAGGENFHSFIKIIKLLNQKNLVGADIVELAPMLDATGNSSVFAAKTVREVLLGDAKMIKQPNIVPIQFAHAEELFSLVFNTSVTDTIHWNGPKDKQEYLSGIKDIVAKIDAGEIHFFTIIDPESNSPCGSCDIRPEDNGFRASVGLWIGEDYHGKGIGTKAIADLTAYGFNKLKLEKIEATIYVGNTASRKVFEKCGYSYEGTIRCAAKKRGKLIDEWLMGILKTEFESL